MQKKCVFVCEGQQFWTGVSLNRIRLQFDMSENTNPVLVNWSNLFYCGCWCAAVIHNCVNNEQSLYKNTITFPDNGGILAFCVGGAACLCFCGSVWLHVRTHWDGLVIRKSSGIQFLGGNGFKNRSYIWRTDKKEEVGRLNVNTRGLNKDSKPALGYETKNRQKAQD